MSIETQKLPTWVRIIQLIAGGIALVLSGVVLSNPVATTWYFLLFLGFSLIVIGMSNIINGGLGGIQSKGTRAIEIGIGIVAILGGIFTLIHPIAALATLIWFISLFVLIFGAGLVIAGFAAKNQSKVARIVRIIIGMIIVVLSGLLLEYPQATLSMMIIFLSINLFIKGIDRIITGAIGYRLVRKV